MNASAKQGKDMFRYVLFDLMPVANKQLPLEWRVYELGHAYPVLRVDAFTYSSSPNKFFGESILICYFQDTPSTA
jgi:hypothetical protein